MSSVFTHINITQGNVGIGKLPIHLYSTLDSIKTEYYRIVTDKSKTTYHTYYKDLHTDLKNDFDKIQYDTFWNSICDNPNTCIIQNVLEMNEMYYSNPKPNFKNMNLYGAAANLIPHRDCLLYEFDGISMYRIIIGLTDGNNDTITEFTNFHLEHKINRGDYMIFDFDKTVHQVIKTGNQETQRILMKLHFIVCDNCKYTKEYVIHRSYFYILYYIVARYTEQIGTDPTTFMGFFFGLLWEWPFYKPFRSIVALLFINNMIMVNRFYRNRNTMLQIKNTEENTQEIGIQKIVLYSMTNVFLIYLGIVLFYYVRYSLFNIR